MWKKVGSCARGDEKNPDFQPLTTMSAKLGKVKSCIAVARYKNLLENSMTSRTVIFKDQDIDYWELQCDRIWHTDFYEIINQIRNTDLDKI